MSRNPWPRTLWTWARGSGGLPVDLKAFSASTVVRLSMSPSLSKPTPDAPQGVAPVENGHAGNGVGRLIVDLNLPDEDAWWDYLRQALPQ